MGGVIHILLLIAAVVSVVRLIRWTKGPVATYILVAESISKEA